MDVQQNESFMSVVEPIAETGQIVAVDFRQGNVLPAQNNLAFTEQCSQSSPEGCDLKAFTENYGLNIVTSKLNPKDKKLVK